MHYFVMLVNAIRAGGCHQIHSGTLFGIIEIGLRLLLDIGGRGDPKQ